MPFRSEAQRRWMFARKPEMAKRWAAETPPGKLPEKVKEGCLGASLPPLVRLALSGEPSLRKLAAAAQVLLKIPKKFWLLATLPMGTAAAALSGTKPKIDPARQGRLPFPSLPEHLEKRDAED